MDRASRRIATACLLAALATAGTASGPVAAGDLVITIVEPGSVERSGAELARQRNREDDGTQTGRQAADAERRLLARRRAAIARDRTARVRRALARRSTVTSAPVAPSRVVADGLPRMSLTRLPVGGVRVAAERTPSSATPQGALVAQLDGFLAERGSPLAGLGSTFVSEGRRWGVDPRLLVAISGAETSFATYKPSQTIHNPFGLGPGRDYPTWAHAISAAASNLAGPGYRGAGRLTIPAIQLRWAPLGAANDPTGLNSTWTRNVSRYYAELGGDPSGSVFTGATNQVEVLPFIASGQIGGTATGPAVAVPGGGVGAGPWAAQDVLALLGTPYRHNGDAPTVGFDAAGLVRYVYARRGVLLPNSLTGQARLGRPVAPSDLRPGDALFFARDGGIHHAGVYIGAGQFVHAAPDGGVRRSSLAEPAITAAYAGARRY